MSLLAIALLAVGTFAFRLAGPTFGDRMRVSARVQRLLTIAAAVLLIALVSTAGLFDGRGFAGWARPAGVLVVRSEPRLDAGEVRARTVVVVAAAATTAVLRWCGVS